MEAKQYKGALDEIRYISAYGGEMSALTAVIAAQAVAMRIPHKPAGTGKPLYICPMCGQVVGYRNGERRAICLCGQTIDWEGV